MLTTLTTIHTLMSTSLRITFRKQALGQCIALYSKGPHIILFKKTINKLYSELGGGGGGLKTAQIALPDKTL